MRLTTIAFTYLKQTFASRGVLIFSLLMPVIFTVVLAIAMQGMGTDDNPAAWTLLLADQDHSPQSAALTAQLQAETALNVVTAPADEIAARVEDGAAPAGLVIPSGFGAALLDGESADLRLIRSARDLTTAQAVEQAVQTAAGTLEGIRNAVEIAARTNRQLGLPSAPAEEAFTAAAELWQQSAVLTVQAEPVTRLDEDAIPIGAAQSSPGMMVMFVLFMTFGGGAALLVERERGTLRRLLVMPVRKATLLGGKLLGIYISALVQMSLMILVGRFALGVNWGRSLPALTLMLLTYAFAATTLGILVAALARTSSQADGLSTITVLALSALGGAWWPIEIVPGWMQNLARAFPTYWGMQGFQDLILRGLGVSEILPEAGILLAFGVVFLALGLWRFRWE